MNCIYQENKKNEFYEKIEEKERLIEQQKRRKGLQLYLQSFPGSFTEEIKVFQKETEDDDDLILSKRQFYDLSSIDYALCAFVFAMICEILMKNGYSGITWFMVTPLSLIGLITIYITLFSVLNT